MTKKADPANCGQKIDQSEHVWNVTKLIYENLPDTKIVKVLQERYGWRVSVPSIAAFRRNYYEHRLFELKRSTVKFQQQQSGQMQTFIDESQQQASAIKQEVDTLARQLQQLLHELDFSRKFENIFRHAIDYYIESFDPQNPQEFLTGTTQASAQETQLSQAVKAMGSEGRGALQAYIMTHNSHLLTKLLYNLTTKLKDSRSAVVNIHKDIFKSYRNLSITQEMTIIFEKYNGIIIEEFFPDKTQVDPQKFHRVNAKIRALFDELQTRYQGIDSPKDKGRNPDEQQLQAVAEGQMPDIPQPKVEDVLLSGPAGRPPSKYRQAQRQAQANNQPVVADDGDEEELTDEQAAAALAQLEQPRAAEDQFFTDIIEDRQPGQPAGAPAAGT